MQLAHVEGASFCVCKCMRVLSEYIAMCIGIEVLADLISQL